MGEQNRDRGENPHWSQGDAQWAEAAKPASSEFSAQMPAVRERIDSWKLGSDLQSMVLCVLGTSTSTLHTLDISNVMF